MPHIIIPPSVKSLTPAPRAPDIFDHSPHRNVGQPTIAQEMPHTPDSVLIATAVAYGCPRWVAEQCRYHGPARFQLALFWSFVQDANEGDGGARERVDYCRHMWQQYRQDDVISDTPDHVEDF